MESWIHYFTLTMQKVGECKISILYKESEICDEKKENPTADCWQVVIYGKSWYLNMCAWLRLMEDRARRGVQLFPVNSNPVQRLMEDRARRGFNSSPSIRTLYKSWWRIERGGGLTLPRQFEPCTKVDGGSSEAGFNSSPSIHYVV